MISGCTFVTENLRAIMGYRPEEMTTDPRAGRIISILTTPPGFSMKYVPLSNGRRDDRIPLSAS